MTIPFDGIEMVYPHDPLIKLDGGHGDTHHRNELMRHKVRVDPVKWEQFHTRVQRDTEELGIKEDESYTLFGAFGERQIDPLVEELDGWIRMDRSIVDTGDHRSCSTPH
jgi:hypothetical protein